jgi:cytochrome c oxidase subunit 3
VSAEDVRAADRGESRPPLVSVGMVLFLGSELMFFGALFATYFVLRAAARSWPPPSVRLDLPEPAAFTAVLVASSGTMQAAVARIGRGDVGGLVRWVWVTAALGAVFLAGQGLGYARATFDIASGPYGSAFYAMTGFHALHVLAGLLLLLVVVGRAGAGASSREEHAGVEAVAYYWHFVDVVWIGLFSAIYLVR